MADEMKLCREALIKKVMAEHWLMSVNCNHEAKTDRAQCSCSQWRGKEVSSVKDAVDDYCDHFLEQVRQAAHQHRLPADRERAIEAMVEALRGIEVISNADATWFLMRCNHKDKTGSGSVRLDGQFAKDFKKWGERRDSALAAYGALLAMEGEL